MPAVPFDRKNPPSAGSSLAWSRRPGRATWLLFWAAILFIVVGLRWWIAVHLPTYVWTRDSGSYLLPVLRWLDGNAWVTSARRGPVYSLFLAAILKSGGTLRTVANAQAVVGGGTFLLILAFGWRNLDRRSFWPFAVCSLFFAVHALPLELERLIRNETLLLLLATVAFGGWFRALLTGRPGWFAVSGLFTGLMHLLKGIFPIFPVIVLATVFWNWRQRLPRAGSLAAIYFCLFLLPLVSSRLYSRMSGTTRPPEPEDGQMFYGRTAQWTYLEADGILPDIKARIRDQAQAYAERYRRTGKLDNNEIVKRTVVPTLKKIVVEERGGTLIDVNRMSWRLGLEAVKHHPFAYLRQFLHDQWVLNFVSAQKTVAFEPKELRTAGRDARNYAVEQNDDHLLIARVFALGEADHALESATRPDGGLQRFSRFLTAIGRARLVSPVFLTTLLLPLLVWRHAGRRRLFWLGMAALWYYYLVLLGTVGRPLERYFMPVAPVMFWTISTAATLAWLRWVSPWLRRLKVSASQSSSGSSVGVGLTR